MTVIWPLLFDGVPLRLCLMLLLVKNTSDCRSMVAVLPGVCNPCTCINTDAVVNVAYACRGVQVCSASRPDANKAATTLKEALGGGAEWAVLCCTMRLLKLVIKVQADASQPKEGGGGDPVLQDRVKATFGGKVPSVSQRRSAIRSQLASCFADVWFPPINLEVSAFSLHIVLLRFAPQQSYRCL